LPGTNDLAYFIPLAKEKKVFKIFLPGLPIGSLGEMPKSVGRFTGWSIEIYGARSASGRRPAPGSARTAKLWSDHRHLRHKGTLDKCTSFAKKQTNISSSLRKTNMICHESLLRRYLWSPSLPRRRYLWSPSLSVL
jgi:hypothetical protein